MRLKNLAATTAASALIATGLALVADVPAQAATRNTVRASPSAPIVNEKFTVTGKLSTAVKRKAYLQLKSAGEWKKTDTATTSSSGAYTLASRTKVDRDYRIVAPAVTIKGKAYARINGPVKTIHVVEQTATIKVSDLTPQPDDVITITGTFSPARKGRPVLAFIRVGGSTFKLNRETERSSGRATWTARVESSDVGVASDFYVRAFPHHGAATVTSTKVTVTAEN